MEGKLIMLRYKDTKIQQGNQISVWGKFNCEEAGMMLISGPVCLLQCFSSFKVCSRSVLPAGGAPEGR